MSSGNMLKQKKGIQLPHIYVLLFSIIVVCTILTWVLPAGEFDRVVNEATGRTVAVAGTFHTVEQSPVGIFQMFQAIYNGMCDAGSVTFFVFISYASINIIISSGAFNGLVAGLLKVYRGQNEMIITIMLNYVATLFMGVVYTNWLRDGSVPQTQAVPDATQLSRLFGLRVTSAFVIALVVGLLVYYFLFYTSKGFQLRAVGLNMTAAEFNGFAVKKYILMSFIVSGAIAGLGGSAELLGTQFRLINGFGNGYGFDGVAMALIGQLHPLATILVAIFFAALRVGSTTMQAATGVPTSVSDIIQALVIVFTVAGLAMVKLPGFKAFLGRLTERRKEAA